MIQQNNPVKDGLLVVDNRLEKTTPNAKDRKWGKAKVKNRVSASKN